MRTRRGGPAGGRAARPFPDLPWPGGQPMTAVAGTWPPGPRRRPRPPASASIST